jgi:hypothetical protein
MQQQKAVSKDGRSHDPRVLGPEHRRALQQLWPELNQANFIGRH